jgi:hypothetical protein
MSKRFESWLKSSPPGSEYPYHTGTRLAKDEAGHVFSDAVFSAREAFERGEVILVQRRLKKGAAPNLAGTFQWLAVKRRVPIRSKPSSSTSGDFARWVSRPGVRRSGV